MGTKFRTPQEGFEYRMRKNSVVKELYVILKPLKTWEEGMSFKGLKAEIERRRNRTYSNTGIYNEISSLNKFGKAYGIYIRSGFGYCDDGIKEYRYFVPTEQFDISKEKIHLESRKELIELKEDNLEHHEKVTIPHEQQITQFSR